MTTAEASEAQTALAPATDGGRSPMQAATLVFGASAILLVVCFTPTIQTMVRLWAASSSFHHGFLVAPIALWLILRIEGVFDKSRMENSATETRRAFRNSARVRAACSTPSVPLPHIWTPALFVVTIGLMGWLAGRAANVNFIEEASFITTLIGFVILIYGPGYARRWAFPLLFLFFMAPFGDALIPPLQNFAAEGVVALLKASGVPATLDGVMIETSAGRFEVAEACAGLNFLLAAIMMGAIFAHLSFSSARKGAAFICFSVILALGANIIRAWILVLAATLSNGAIAIGTDHLVFGWLFYGVLLFVLVLIGRTFADLKQDATEPPLLSFPSQGRSWPLAMALAIVVLTAGYGRLVIDRAPNTVAPSYLPLVSAAGWRALPPSSEWRAPLSHADRVVHALYQSGAGAVALNVAYFTHDRVGAEVAGRDSRSYDGYEWRRIASQSLYFSAYGAQRAMNVDTIENAVGSHLETVTLYWLDEQIETNPVAFKLRQARLRLLGRPPRSGVIILAAHAPEPMDGARAIQALLSDIEPLSAWLSRIDARIES